MVEDPDRSLNRAKFFQVLAVLALAFPPTLLLLATLFHYAGSYSIAPPLMYLVFVSSFVCIFVSFILILIALVLLLFGMVEVKHIRFGAGLAVLASLTNFLIFYFVVFNFFRPH